jgi:RNA polymerase sigma-70 factor (ECF subfamily)
MESLQDTNTMSKNDEISLIVNLSRGDQKAFEILFLNYQPRLIYFLNGFIKDNEKSRDIAQDIFLSIWKNRQNLSEIKSFKAFVFKMAKNAICNYYDHSIVKDKFVVNQLSRPSSSLDTEETLYANQLQELINITVSQMPPKRKQIFQMSRIDGLSNEEISEQLNISKRTVENHLTAALADLRKVIKICILFFY